MSFCDTSNELQMFVKSVMKSDLNVCANGLMSAWLAYAYYDTNVKQEKEKISSTDVMLKQQLPIEWKWVTGSRGLKWDSNGKRIEWWTLEHGNWRWTWTAHFPCSFLIFSLSFSSHFLKCALFTSNKAAVLLIWITMFLELDIIRVNLNSNFLP